MRVKHVITQFGLRSSAASRRIQSARAAALTALAVIPVVSGLTAATDPAQITHAFRVGLVVTAVVTAAAGPLAFFGLGEHARAPRTARHVHCALDGAPLQPDRC